MVRSVAIRMALIALLAASGLAGCASVSPGDTGGGIGGTGARDECLSSRQPLPPHCPERKNRGS